jgi:hypothetical protein
MSIPTAHTLRTRNRRVDRQLAQAENVLRAMAGGASLHLTYSRSGAQWVLSTGRSVSDAAARAVVASSSVIDCGGSLFPWLGLPGQVWRFWRAKEENGA